MNEDVSEQFWAGISQPRATSATTALLEHTAAMSGVTFQKSIEGRCVFAGNHVSDGGNVNIHLLPERPDTPPHPSSSIIPFRRDPNFVPRGDILDRLHELCSKPAGRAALVGLGGVGKSQLAIEFAHQLKAANTTLEVPVWLFWVHASTASRIEQGFKDIAEVIKIPDRTQPGADIMQLVYSTLSKEVWGRWYMILDSCDDYDVLFGVRGNAQHERPVATYLPQSENGSILVTTRNRDIAYRLTNEPQAIMKIGPMLEQEAIRLLESRLGPLSDAGTASDLVQALDLIPLAISQAAAHIQARQPFTSIEKYLADFRASENQRIKLLDYDAGDLRRDGGASNAVLTTWKLSFEHIRLKWPSAANLLSLMSFFNPQGIPKWLLEHYRQGKSVTRTTIPDRRDTEPEGQDEKRDKRRLSSLLCCFHGKDISSKRPNPSTNATSTPLETLEHTDIGGQGSIDGISNTFDDDICILRDYFLVTATEVKDMFEMHGLVQLSTRKWLRDNGLQDNFKQQYVSLLAKWFPSGWFENWTTCEELFPHVQDTMKYFPGIESDQEAWSVPLAHLLFNSGNYCIQKSLFDAAEKVLQVSVMIAKKKFGNKDQRTLRHMLMLAEAIRKKRRDAEAEELLLEVLEVQRNVLEADHPDISQSMNRLALLYFRQKRYAEAERLHLQVLEVDRNLHGIDHAETLTTMDSLAMTYLKQGRRDEAEELQLRVLEGKKNLLGTDHPKTLAVMNNLALSYLQQGEYDKAERLQLQVLETSKNVLGADHADTLTNMGNLAATYTKQCRYGEAEELRLHILEIHKSVLGTEHPKTLKNMHELASVYAKQSRIEEALEMMRTCAEGRARALGADHPSTLKSLSRIEKWSRRDSE